MHATIDELTTIRDEVDLHRWPLVIVIDGGKPIYAGDEDELAAVIFTMAAVTETKRLLGESDDRTMEAREISDEDGTPVIVFAAHGETDTLVVAMMRGMPMSRFDEIGPPHHTIN